MRLPLRGTGSDLSSRAVSSQVLSALESLTTVFGMGTGGTSPSLPPVDFRAGFVLSLPHRFLLAFLSVRSLSASLPVFPEPSACCYLLLFARFASFPFPSSPLPSLSGSPLPFRSLLFRSLLRSSLFCFFSVPFRSASFLSALCFPSDPFAFHFPAFPFAFAPFLRLFPALHFSVHPDNCTSFQIQYSTFTIDLIVSFVRLPVWPPVAFASFVLPFCLPGLLYQALESSPRPISINNLHVLPHFQR